MTFTELSKSSIFVVKSLAPPPLPLLVGVLNTTSPSFGSGWHATFIRDNGSHRNQYCKINGTYYVGKMEDGVPLSYMHLYRSTVYWITAIWHEPKSKGNPSYFWLKCSFIFCSFTEIVACISKWRLHAEWHTLFTTI